MSAVQEKFKQAKVAMASGNTGLARTLLRQILEIHPNSSETLFHLARVDLADGKAKRAKRHLLAARKLRPQEPGIWAALMDVEIALKDRKAIGKLLREAKSARLPPGLITQLVTKTKTGNRQGIANMAGLRPGDFERARDTYLAGEFAQAEEICRALLRKHPKVAPLHAVLAASLARQGDTNGARQAYEKALEYDANYFEARLQLGQLELGCNDLVASAKHLSKAYDLAQDSPQLHLALGVLNCERNNYAKALEHLDIAKKSLPDEPRLLLYLARASQAQGHIDAAQAALLRAQKSPLDEAERDLLVTTLVELGEMAAATDIIAATLAQNPDHIPALQAHAEMATTTGDFDAMRRIIRKLVALGEASGNQLLSYSRAEKLAKDDPILGAMEAAFAAPCADEDGGDERSNLAFALAKTYDDFGEYSKSFNYLKDANRIAYDLEGQDANVARDGFELARRSFARSVDLWSAAGSTPQDFTPNSAGPRSIQITGMPRSGTTLVEQIISSHSQVEAAGEYGTLAKQARDWLSIPDAQEQPLGAADLHAFGTSITREYAQLFPNAKVVTDKAIMSNVFTGIFAHALPQDRMVVLRRDPRDNCYSIYKNRFQRGTHPYSTDLEALGHQYLYFLETLEYWRQHVPGGFYEISYEGLIANPEHETRALIDYCGLEWEDACLSFYENKRAVKTLSAFQVRQPLYSSSVAAWKPYEDELQPLIRVLADGGALDGY